MDQAKCERVACGHVGTVNTADWSPNGGWSEPEGIYRYGLNRFVNPRDLGIVCVVVVVLGKGFFTKILYIILLRFSLKRQSGGLKLPKVSSDMQMTTCLHYRRVNANRF